MKKETKKEEKKRELELHLEDLKDYLTLLEKYPEEEAFVNLLEARLSRYRNTLKK